MIKQLALVAISLSLQACATAAPAEHPLADLSPQLVFQMECRDKAIKAHPEYLTNGYLNDLGRAANQECIEQSKSIPEGRFDRERRERQEYLSKMTPEARRIHELVYRYNLRVNSIPKSRHYRVYR